MRKREEIGIHVPKGRDWPFLPVGPMFLPYPSLPGSDHTLLVHHLRKHHTDVTWSVGFCSSGLVAPMMLPACWTVPVLLPGLGWCGLIACDTYLPWEGQVHHPEGVTSWLLADHYAGCPGKARRMEMGKLYGFILAV